MRDKKSLGICKLIELMIKIGIIEGDIKLIKNKSNRFESRFSNVIVKYLSNTYLLWKNSNGDGLLSGEGQFVI